MNDIGEDMDIYNVKDFGAVADGKTNCASPIQTAVDTANRAGGGVVLLPAGRYFSGSILLKSNVELRLETGAVLISSLNEADTCTDTEACETVHISWEED